MMVCLCRSNLRPRSDLLSRRYSARTQPLAVAFCGHVRPPWEGRCIDLYRTSQQQIPSPSLPELFVGISLPAAWIKFGSDVSGKAPA